jgi:Zn-dependent protease
MSKIYYSFQDMPFNKWEENPYEPEKILKFSKNEIIQILIAIAVLTIAFSFALTPTDGIPLLNISQALSLIPIAFLAIVTAFFCHELGHKFMGQKYGYWSEFRMFPMGLLLALFLGLFTGIVFAAPGAVTIMGHPNKDEYGKISAIGPSINIFIAVIFYLLTIVTPAIISGIFAFIAFINAFLAFFNLLPFGPLDGMKIFRWRKEIWLTLGVLSISLVYLTYQNMDLFYSWLYS